VRRRSLSEGKQIEAQLFPRFTYFLRGGKEKEKRKEKFEGDYSTLPPDVIWIPKPPFIGTLWHYTHTATTSLCMEAFRNMAPLSGRDHFEEDHSFRIFFEIGLVGRSRPRS
jgi:hypothetical protein